MIWDVCLYHIKIYKNKTPKINNKPNNSLVLSYLLVGMIEFSRLVFENDFTHIHLNS